MVTDGVSNLERPTAKLAGLWRMRSRCRKAPQRSPSDPAPDDDLRFTTAAGHCGQAADEIQRTYPEAFRIVAVPALAEHLAQLSMIEATERLLAAIATVVQDFDLDNPGLGPTDLLAVGSAATWIGLAQRAISGRLPWPRR